MDVTIDVVLVLAVAAAQVRHYLGRLRVELCLQVLLDLGDDLVVEVEPECVVGLLDVLLLDL